MRYFQNKLGFASYFCRFLLSTVREGGSVQDGAGSGSSLGGREGLGASRDFTLCQNLPGEGPQHPLSSDLPAAWTAKLCGWLAGVGAPSLALSELRGGAGVFVCKRTGSQRFPLPRRASTGCSWQTLFSRSGGCRGALAHLSLLLRCSYLFLAGTQLC